MASECSFLCSLQLWTLKYAGLHDSDLSIHSYQQKPPPPKKSLLSFIHNSSSNNDSSSQKPTYYDEYNNYYASRFLPFHISNKFFCNLRDKLSELDELLTNLKLVRTIWLCYDMFFLAFSNGTLVFICLDEMNRTLKSIVIDKTTIEKRLKPPIRIADIYLNGFGLYIIYETLSKMDIFLFKKPLTSFSSKIDLSEDATTLTSEELPPFSDTIPVRRWLHVHHEHCTITVWWSILSEGMSTKGYVMDGDNKNSRFNCLSILFPHDNTNEKRKIFSLQTETSNPYFCSSSQSGLTTVEMAEHVDQNNSERTYELNMYYYENFRSVPLRLVHIPSLACSALHVIRSSSHTIVCLTDSTLICIDEVNHVQRSRLCVLSRKITGMWWIIDNLLFSIADELGSFIFYDIALNPIWPTLSSNQKINFTSLLNQNTFIVAISKSVNATLPSKKDTIPSNLTLLLQFSHGGPIGLLDIHYPLDNIHSLFKYYLNSQNFTYIIDLLWSMDWSRQDNDCRLAVSFVTQEIFRRMNCKECFYIEQILRTFYSPLRPISDASILRNRSFINQIATRYFYFLLRSKLYSSALQLAKHLDNRTVYLDLYYACDYDNEKTIMNACAEKLLLNKNHDIDNYDDESGLSVTSSEDETESDRTVKQRFPPMSENPYGDINEILTSAIEHYKLDENMYRFLLDRLHAM